MMLKTITSRSNPAVKKLLSLSTSSRERRASAQTLLDGAHLIQSALATGFAMQQLVVSDSGLQRAEITALLSQCGDVPALHLPDGLFRHVSPVDTPSGILALIDIPSESRRPLIDESVIVLDGVQDSGNLGTILRTAAAAGITRALLTGGCAQAWSPRTLRAGMGGHFHLAIVEQLGCDDIAALLRGYSGAIVATALTDTAQTLYDTDLNGAVAWLFGAEGQGLSAEMGALATTHVTIPMTATVESLNVAAAAAVCLFEQARQRRLTNRR